MFLFAFFLLSAATQTTESTRCLHRFDLVRLILLSQDLGTQLSPLRPSAKTLPPSCFQSYLEVWRTIRQLAATGVTVLEGSSTFCCFMKYLHILSRCLFEGRTQRGGGKIYKDK